MVGAANGACEHAPYGVLHSLFWMHLDRSSCAPHLVLMSGGSMGRNGTYVPLHLLHGARINALVQRSCGWLAIVAKAKGGRMKDRRFSNEESQLLPAPRSEIRSGGILDCQVCLPDLESLQRGR